MSLRYPQFILLSLLLWHAEVLAQQTTMDFPALIAEAESAEIPPLIQRDLLAPAPSIVTPVLSPDGKRIVYGEIEGLQTNLKLLDTQSLQERSLFNTARLEDLYWTRDSENIVFELDNAVGYLPVDSKASPSYVSLLDRAKGDYFLGPDGASPSHALIVRISEGIYSLERVSFAGVVEELYRTPLKIVNAVSTTIGGPLFLQLESEIDQNIYQLTGDNLEEIITCGVLDECYLETYDGSEGILWLRMDAGIDRLSLFSWAEESGVELVYTDPVDRAILFQAHYVNSSPVIVQYPSSALLSYGIDEKVQSHIDVLDRSFPNHDYVPYPSSGSHWLIAEHGAILREANYYLYNTGQQTIEQVLTTEKQSPVVESSQLSPMHFFQYPAQDNLPINGFLLLPKGRDISRAPMVTFVHGGPFARIASQQYSRRLQVLTNRGYIVFVPNFRGSTGYGKQYTLSSNKDFGDGVIQRDIIDGIDFLLSNGIGDEEKLAIVGGSFGGFSVLGGLAFTPDLFKVGLAAVPPADMVRGIRVDTNRYPSDPLVAERLRVMVVDRDDAAQVEALYKKSPLASLDKISAPIVVLAGADDQGIDINHVKEYSLALLNNGNAITLLIDEDEGHSFSSDESTAAYLYLMEEVLAMHLGGERQGLQDDVLRAYLQDKIQINSISGFLEGL